VTWPTDPLVEIESTDSQDTQGYFNFDKIPFFLRTIQSRAVGVVIMNAAEEKFTPVKKTLLSEGGVEEKSMFGSQGLSVRGKYFVMIYKGEMIVKLPAERVQELIAKKIGKPWDPGHGRKMREWVAFLPNKGDWMSLAREGMGFTARMAAANASEGKKKKPNNASKKKKSSGNGLEKKSTRKIQKSGPKKKKAAKKSPRS